MVRRICLVALLFLLPFAWATRSFRLGDPEAGEVRRSPEDMEKARAALEEALCILPAVKDERSRSKALSIVVAAMARVDAERALQLAQDIRDPLSQPLALIDVACGFAETDPARAVEIARGIQEGAWPGFLSYMADVMKERLPGLASEMARGAKPEMWRDFALSQVAATAAKKNPDLGLEIAGSIEGEGGKAAALVQVVVELVKTDPGRALTVARSVTDAGARAGALTSVAQAFVKSDLEHSAEIAREAVDLERSMQPGVERDWALRDTLGVLAQADPNQALAIARGMETAQARVAALAMIGWSLRTKHPEWSSEVAFEALQDAQVIAEEGQRGEAVSAVVRVLAESRPDLALDAARSITSSWTRGFAVLLVAQAVARSDLDRAFEVLESIDDEGVGMFAVRSLTGAIAKVDLGRALKMAESLGEKYRPTARRLIIQSLAGTDLQAALNLARSIEQPAERASALASAVREFLDPLPWSPMESWVAEGTAEEAR